MQNTIPVIAVDGPSGSGKGTISMSLANKLGWGYLDSGVLYRALVYLAEKQNINFSNTDKLVVLAENLDVQFFDGQIWLNGHVASDKIRTEEMGASASIIASIQEIRDALYLWQRRQIRTPGLIADGRDMGTVVFPDALCKLFITANIRTRAERRYRQLIDKGFNVSMQGLSEEIARRDERDVKRKISPLRAAEDAVVIDTTLMSVEQVVERALGVIQQLL